MASSTKRAWMLQEFVAHSGNVNCLSIGHKSGRVMVTGGDDKKVNMWAIGKPNAIMSLSGHTSPVEAVRFGNAEEMVVAGSMSGALKIWDLEEAKIMRTLTGHKSSVRSLHFHPYGDYVASGSLDTNIKLWDIRRKGCIFTYKGHSGCVNDLKFSPDGKWIASAGEDGLLKLWDLTAGKMLTDFRGHTSSVTTVEFHPSDLLIASGSADRTVKFWDLESFQMVSSTDGDSTPVRAIAFHSDGQCLYSAATDQFKVYAWEPARCLDTLSIRWGRVAEIAQAQNQLIGAAFSDTNVSTFVIDAQRIQPASGPPLPPVQMVSPPVTARSGRRSFVERPPTQSTRQISQPKEEPDDSSPTDDPGDDLLSAARIEDPANYQEVFAPRSRLEHSPSREVKPFPAPLEDERAPSPVSQPPRPATSAGQAPPSQKPVEVKKASSPKGRKTHSEDIPKPAPKAKVPPSPPSQSKAQSGLDVDDFLPKASVPSLLAGGQGEASDMSEAEALSMISKGHHSMMQVLNSRQEKLQVLRAMWTSGSTKTSIDSALGMRDQAVIVDLVNVMLQKDSLWSLDVSASVLPELMMLLDSKYESYVSTGLSAVKLILKNFAPVIKSNVTAPPLSGVDISREERYHKCKACYRCLMDIRSALEQRNSFKGNMAPKIREVFLLMSTLD
ncbi:hypothetical protein CAPTEDRAFT_177482 [Capitella teleta]|uniref:Katanin p80 WD40 repeat-containing subunit B1 n=1 Tax=Capitella teleta TaxID=283909 RepID=R7TMW3_CAPTE|nr:hypothetical protein CAPTEDRAFT_177482 [Capitella teleta]|eukprot:ELT94847.1 hypothetical protein CAPTEDRAFT_177482 [Capitella teleta]